MYGGGIKRIPGQAVKGVCVAYVVCVHAWCECF